MPTHPRVPDPPPPLGRRERKKLETKERILDCAVALFGSRGYDATTIEDIGESADVARATVFNYFARKEDIVSEVFKQRRAQLAALITEAEAATSNTADRLRRALRGLARLYEDDPAGGRAMVRAWVRAGGPLWPEATDSAALFTDVIRAGQRQGEIAAGVDAICAGLVILDAYIGTVHRWVSHEAGQFDLEVNLLGALDLILAGITPQPAAKRDRKRERSR